VIQAVEPFVSSQEIYKGERWRFVSKEEMQNSKFGILCVTKDNFNSPWLIFEAGALSKLEKTYVFPLLFGLNASDLKDSPFLQFQVVTFSKENMKRLVKDINIKTERPLDSEVLYEIFEILYPRLEANIKTIMSAKYIEYDILSEEKAERILPISYGTRTATC